MKYAYRKETWSREKLSEETLRKYVFYYMAITIELAHSFSNKTTEELSSILGITPETLLAAEHADMDVALSSEQLRKLEILLNPVFNLWDLDELYHSAGPDSYRDDDDGDPVYEWNDEYVGEYDDTNGDLIILKVWEVNEIERHYGSIHKALEEVYYPVAECQ